MIITENKWGIYDFYPELSDEKIKENSEKQKKIYEKFQEEKRKWDEQKPNGTK